MPAMDNRIEQRLPVTLSGVRAGEGPAVEAVMTDCGLHTEDISAIILRNTIVARKGHRIIGTVALEVAGDAGLLRSLAVVEKYRGQGVAAQLVTAAEKAARLLGIQTLYLLTMTAESFFRDMGFDKIERSSAPEAIRDTAEFRTLCPDSALCMKKAVA